MPTAPIVVIGAGLAGLACALRLQEKGVGCTLLEAAGTVGGRVRTDRQDGFQLDRGFQVLLTAYPETRRTLDTRALGLKGFRPGALVRARHRFYKLADLTRVPSAALRTALTPVATVGDKLRMLRLWRRVCGPALQEVLDCPESTTRERLAELGFSEKMVAQFFRPFLGGIFLENELSTSSRKFEFVFRMFSLGAAALPAEGMEAIPRQLAARLKPGVLRTESRVLGFDDRGVQLAGGETVAAQRVVLATEGEECARLLGKEKAGREASVTCLYYAAERSPVKGPWLVLNGEGAGPVNNLCVPSEVQRCYAPESSSGKPALISVSVVDPAFRGRPDLETAVRAQLSGWYGNAVSEWRFLREYAIDRALPLQEPPALTPVAKPAKLSERLFVCGDGSGIASIEGAIASGRRAADALSGNGFT